MGMAATTGLTHDRTRSQTQTVQTLLASREASTHGSARIHRGERSHNQSRIATILPDARAPWHAAAFNAFPGWRMPLPVQAVDAEVSPGAIRAPGSPAPHRIGIRGVTGPAYVRIPYALRNRWWRLRPFRPSLGLRAGAKFGRFGPASGAGSPSTNTIAHILPVAVNRPPWSTSPQPKPISRCRQ
jgi:hypothetical protein